MRALIVALLCLTLFVDSAKACWWLRQHGSRARVCRPAACRPASLPRCGAVAGEPLASGEVVFVDEHAGCFCNAAIAEHAAIDQTIDQTTTHEAVEPAARVEESVVVHGPTLVVDTTPAQPAPGGPAASSVVIAPAADTPSPAADAASPAAAQPMPVAATGPAVLPTPTATQEPIPELKPAVASPSPVAPVSNEQPVPEPQAPVPAAALAEPADAQEAMPAPAEDLAGGPDVKPAMPEPQEPNLFDLYGDEGDESGDEGDDGVAPSEEPPADTPAEEVEADAGEPAEESAAASPSDAEPEMSDEDAAAVEADEADSETPEPADEPAADDAADEPTDDTDAAPAAEPEQAEADPAAAATVVPNEPMRRWTNATGTHQAQGWLVEVRTDRVRILKVNGRHTTMSTESLSTADRDYVSAVSARLAAERQGKSPAAVDTAGL
jgi:hypothetical protein